MNDEITMDLFFSINDAINSFSKKHPKFYKKVGLSEVGANALCMIVATFIDASCKEQPLKVKLEMLKDIMQKNKEFLMMFEKQDIFAQEKALSTKQ